ncbi:MAG: RNA-binding S4 domain-containing protein [Lentimicrobiaceae bacterium]|nr:RNA-binding S4 domain-containing protein [Lentimicrobiaceae bacterium]
MTEEGCRIDKFLWSVRLFKTRNQASTACRAGKVRMGDQAVKPSREVKLLDVIVVRVWNMTRTIRVKELLHNRVGAKLVEVYIEEMTPPEEFERAEMLRKLNAERRDRGAGRPTKKERREISRLKGEPE